MLHKNIKLALCLGKLHKIEIIYLIKANCIRSSYFSNLKLSLQCRTRHRYFIYRYKIQFVISPRLDNHNLALIPVLLKIIVTEVNVGTKFKDGMETKGTAFNKASTNPFSS
jgi:hypothetical protein